MTAAWLECFWFHSHCTFLLWHFLFQNYFPKTTFSILFPSPLPWESLSFSLKVSFWLAFIFCRDNRNVSLCQILIPPKQKITHWNFQGEGFVLKWARFLKKRTVWCSQELLMVLASKIEEEIVHQELATLGATSRNWWAMWMGDIEH